MRDKREGSLAKGFGGDFMGMHSCLLLVPVPATQLGQRECKKPIWHCFPCIDRATN